MSFVGIVEHKGKNITVVDISGCKADESIPKIREGIELIKTQQKNSVLLLTNVSNTEYHKDVFPIIKDYVVSNIPYIKGSAVVGIDGVKKAIFNTLKFITIHEINQFETEEAARDWLTGL
jgi:hypothetical protein